MEFSPTIEMRESSAFVFEMAPIRRSAFIEAVASLEQIETLLEDVYHGYLQVYPGHRVEYSVTYSGQRLVATVGTLSRGLVGVAVDYWGERDKEFNELISRIQRFAAA